MGYPQFVLHVPNVPPLGKFFLSISSLHRRFYWILLSLVLFPATFALAPNSSNADLQQTMYDTDKNIQDKTDNCHTLARSCMGNVNLDLY
jgi:hypothetical protein